MNDDVGSIYFGGGTPSILTETDLEKILNEIHKKFKISNHAEITIECNPDEKPIAQKKAMITSRVNTLLSFPMLLTMVAAQNLY